MTEMKLRREHVVGIRTDLPSCKVHVAPSGKSTSGSIIYPCDNVLVLSDLSTARDGKQSFIETTKPNSRLVAYNISNDGTLLALAENNNSSDNASASLVTLYSLAATNMSKSGGPIATKKKVIQIESSILHVSFVDSTHILILGDGPDYNLTLWSTGTTSLPASPGTRHPRHPGGCLASTKLATPSGKTIYRAEVSPIKDDAGNSLVCITGDGVLRLFRLSITKSTFRPVTVNLKRKQQNYISQLWLSSGQIALGTDTGEILIIESNAAQAVLKLPEPHTVVTSLAETSRGDLIVGSDGSTLHSYEITQDVESRFRHEASNSVAHGGGGINASIASLSVSVVDGREVMYAATTDNRLMIVPLDTLHEESSCGTKTIKPTIPTFLSSKESTCTNSISICLWQPLVAVSSYDSGSKSNCVQVLNYHTRKLEASKSFKNNGPIQSICFHPSSFQIVVGTKEKVIVCNLVHRIAHDSGGERNNDGCPSIIKASGQLDVASAITVCQYSNGGQYLAVCSGATVTIYDAFTLKVICVLRGHSTDLVAIKFQDGDQHFCTIGGDGVLCVWSIPSGRKILRHVHALSSYKCAVIDDKFSRAIVGNANESSVSKIELNLQGKTAQEEVLDFANENEVRNNLQVSSCGRLMVGTTSDTEGGESILITSLTNMEQTGIAPSIRQISSMKLFGQNLFVASNSGSMHHFTIVDMPIDQSPIEEAEVRSAHHAILWDQVLVSESDLMDRRVLIQSLEQQLVELHQQNAHDIQRLDDKCHDALEAIQEQSQLDDREHQRKCREAAEQRSEMEQDSKEAASTLEKAHYAKMKGIEQTMEQKIASEIERTESMKSECASKTREWNDDIKILELQTANEIQQISLDFNKRTENEVQLQAQISKQQEDVLEKHHRLMESLEATGDDEITGIMLESEREVLVEQKATRQLREEQTILKAKLDSLMSDLDEQKDTIESLDEKEVELVASIDEARDYIRQRQSDMHSQDDELSAKREEEVDLKGKCKELNQRHACLEEEIAHRNEVLSQIEADIVDEEKITAQIRTNLAAGKRAHSNVNLAIANLKDKAFGLDRERHRQKSRIDETAAYTLELEKDIFDLVSAQKNCHGEMKAKLLPLCTKYLKTVGDSSSRISSMRLGTSSKRGREAKESELQRREQNLRKKIQTIKESMTKAEKKHAQDMARLRWQQKVLKQNLSEMVSSDDAPTDLLPGEKENSANNGASGE